MPDENDEYDQLDELGLEDTPDLGSGVSPTGFGFKASAHQRSNDDISERRKNLFGVPNTAGSKQTDSQSNAGRTTS